METRELGASGIRCTVLGFGCAGLFRLPRRADRIAALDAAYDVGIRYFDVAPMYGLGRAETEFGRWASDKADDLVIATKFGIDPTPVGRLAGALQGPVRSVLAVRPGLGEKLKSAGRGPENAGVGSTLYRSTGYTPEAAAKSLKRSLRALGRSRVDLLFLHDPAGDIRSATPRLIAHLDEERERGRIRTWGLAGERFEDDPGVLPLKYAAPVLQYRDDAFEPPLRFGDDPRIGKITFGTFGRALDAFRRFVTQSPNQSESWANRLNVDLVDPLTLPALLLRDALRRNPRGPVLLTSTKVSHIRSAVAAVSDRERLSDTREAVAMSELVASILPDHPELGSIP
jgi:D-threo-aldose 1-dehydrogenase